MCVNISIFGISLHIIPMEWSGICMRFTATEEEKKIDRLTIGYMSNQIINIDGRMIKTHRSTHSTWILVESVARYISVKYKVGVRKFQRNRFSTRCVCAFFVCCRFNRCRLFKNQFNNNSNRQLTIAWITSYRSLDELECNFSRHFMPNCVVVCYFHANKIESRIRIYIPRIGALSFRKCVHT